MSTVTVPHDLATVTHNIPPASVARMLRGRCQWAAYQALAAAVGEWVPADVLADHVYQEPYYSWERDKALRSVISRLRAKGIPVQTWYVIGTGTKYRLPLEWQRAQDAIGAEGEVAS